VSSAPFRNALSLHERLLLRRSGAVSRSGRRYADTPGACVTGEAGEGEARRSGTFGELIEASRQKALQSPASSSLEALLAWRSILFAAPSRAPGGVSRPAPETWNTARHLEQLGADAYSIPLLEMEKRPLQDAADLSPGRTGSSAQALGARHSSNAALWTYAAFEPASPPSARHSESSCHGGSSTGRHGGGPTSEGLARLLRSLIRPASEWPRPKRTGLLLPEEAVRQAEVFLSSCRYRMVPRPLPGEELYRELCDRRRSTRWSSAAPPRRGVVGPLRRSSSQCRSRRLGETCARRIRSSWKASEKEDVTWRCSNHRTSRGGASGCAV
jgi:hypothetical protein